MMNKKLLKKFPDFFKENLPDFLKALKTLKDFNKNYGPKYIEQMTLSQYCLGYGNKENYCNMLETETLSLGSVKGGTSLKYGVYYSKSNDDYVHLSYFNNEDEVFEKIKDLVIEIQNINNPENFLNLYRYKCVGKTIRNKITYLYHPKTILPIFSENHMIGFYDLLGVDLPKEKDYYSLNRYLKDTLKANIKNFDKIVISDEVGNIALMYYLYNNLLGLTTANINEKNTFKNQFPIKFYYNDIGDSEKECYVVSLTKNDGNDITYRILIQDKYLSEDMSYDIGQTKILNIDGSIPSFKEGLIPASDLKNIVSFSRDKTFYGLLKEVLGIEIAQIILQDLNDLITKDDDFIREISRFRSFRNEVIDDHAIDFINFTRKNFFLNEKIQGVRGIDFSQGKVKIIIDYLKSKNQLNFTLDFLHNPFGLNRINALIGKNGIGKSTSLQKIAYMLSDTKKVHNILIDGDIIGFNHHTEKTTIRNPFSKIIGISYGIYSKLSSGEDDVNSEENYKGGLEFLNTSNNGVYCHNQMNLSEKIIKLKGRGTSTIYGKSYSVHNDKNGFTNYSIKKLINIFEIDEFKNIDIKYIIENPNKVDELSSGTKVIIAMVIDIIENIKPESLIIIDEPETHLHPEYASILIKIFYKLLEEYNSYMIIGTHSPTIIQQIPSRYVTKLYSDDDNRIHATRLNIESFGNNLTDITYDVFGGDRTTIHYKEHISKLKKNGRTKKEIIDFFDDSKIPLSLRLFIEKTYHEEN